MEGQSNSDFPQEIPIIESSRAGTNGQGDEEEGTLCEKCKSIDFKKVFSMPSVYYGFSGKDVSGHIKDFDPACPMCTLILSLDFSAFGEETGRDFRAQGCHLRALSSLRILSNARTRPADVVGSVVIAAVEGEADEDSTPLEYQFKLNYAISTGIIVPTIPLGDYKNVRSNLCYEYFGRIVNSKHADSAHLIDCLKQCVNSENSTHSSCCLKRARSSIPTRVIDCITREVIPLTVDKEYIALSYVWGSGSMDQVVPGIVPSPAPATIEDAIQVVKELGERYIWIDRYCILDDENKQKQIMSMGLIYEEAKATIIAVTAASSESGLAGVSRPRSVQSLVQTQGLNLVSTMRHCSIHLMSSTWATRGWTYQELIMSRRCILYTDEQVFFACKTSIRSESISQPASASNYPGQERLDISIVSPNPAFGDTEMEELTVTEVTDHIEEYTTRTLSYDSDGLNGIRGILHEQKECTLWGVPFLGSPGQKRTNSHQLLWRGLLWKSGASDIGKDITRRDGFPSWSWTSIKGEIFYPVFSAAGKKNEHLGLDENLRIAAEDSKGDLIDVDRMLSHWQSKSKVMPEQSPYLHVTGRLWSVCLSRDDDSSWLSYNVLAAGVPRKTDEDGPDVLGRAFIDVTVHEEFQSRLIKGTWDVLFMAEIRKGLLRSFTAVTRGVKKQRFQGLLLDWKNGTAFRIGLVKFEFPTLMRTPTVRRQTFKLG